MRLSGSSNRGLTAVITDRPVHGGSLMLSGPIMGSAMSIAIAYRDGVFEPLEEGPDAAAYPHHP